MGIIRKWPSPSSHLVDNFNFNPVEAVCICGFSLRRQERPRIIFPFLLTTNQQSTAFRCSCPSNIIPIWQSFPSALQDYNSAKWAISFMSPLVGWSRAQSRSLNWNGFDCQRLVSTWLALVAANCQSIPRLAVPSLFTSPLPSFSPDTQSSSIFRTICTVRGEMDGRGVPGQWRVGRLGSKRLHWRHHCHQTQQCNLLSHREYGLGHSRQ